MKSNPLMEKMTQIQIEYKVLLQKLLPKLKTDFSVQALDEINLFWYRHMDVVRLYLASGFAGDESYVFTAATYLDYYIQGSDEDVVREFLYDPQNDESRIAWSNLSKVVVLYQSEEERLAFEAYIEKNQPLVATKIACIDRFDYINAGTDTKTAEYKKRLRTGLALNELLKEYRKENKQD